MPGSDRRRWRVFTARYDEFARKTFFTDVTNTTARALGFRYDVKRYALVGEPFCNGAEEIRNAVRDRLDMPYFDVTIGE